MRDEVLEELYNRAKEAAIESGEPHAIILTPEETIESLSLQDYVSQQGYDEAVVFAHEEAIMQWGRPFWLIDCVGGDFRPNPDAFQEALEDRSEYYEDNEREVAISG